MREGPSISDAVAATPAGTSNKSSLAQSHDRLTATTASLRTRTGTNASSTISDNNNNIDNHHHAALHESSTATTSLELHSPSSSRIRQPSVTTALTPLPLPRWYPHLRGGRPIFYGNSEALGWLLDSSGRAVAFIGAGAFLGAALIRLAKQEVGCPVDPPPGSNQVPDCNERVFGILRPSSLLTTYTIIVGLVSAAFLPFMGAVVDYTPHRRLVGRWFSVGVCALQFPQIFVSQSTWLAVALLQIGVAFVGWAQTMVTHAYLPELSNSPQQMSVFTQCFTVCSFGSMVLYLASIVAVSTAMDLGDIDTARLGLSVSFCFSVVTLYPAWSQLLQKRPALRVLPEHQSLWTAGFVQVWKSSKYIYRNWSALKWFYVYVALAEGAVGSLATIMITYLTDRLNFSSTENGTAIMAMLLGSIPGALIAGQVAKRWNPMFGCFLASILLGVNGIVASIVLKQPGQQAETYILASVWGAGTGWKWTTDRLLISTILPDTGQDAELMGLYLFFGQSLTWLPPLLFTGLNEAGVDQRVGLASISGIFFFAALAVTAMGKYEDAVNMAGRMVADQPPDEEQPFPLQEEESALPNSAESPTDKDTVLAAPPDDTLTENDATGNEPVQNGHWEETP